MSIKTKLTSLAIATIILLSVVLVGVWSAVKVDFVISGNLVYIAPEPEGIVKYDKNNKYYYLEMGTYGGSPVRWRYVSDVTNAANGDNSLANAVRFDPTTTSPNTDAGSKGMFILESAIFTAENLKNGNATIDANDGIIEFLPSNMARLQNNGYGPSSHYHSTEGYTGLGANDYAASNLRAFLTGRTNVAGRDVGNLMNVIGIDSDNEIYQKIQGRTLTDLYNGDRISSLPTQIDGSETDMFWSLSYDEVLEILKDDLSWQSIVFEEEGEYIEIFSRLPSTYYWLRSPYDSLGFYKVYGIDSSGLLTGAPYSGAGAVRPAFILEF